MGQSGSTPVATTVKGFRGIKPGSVLIVKGKVQRSGDNVRLVATHFYVGS